MRTRLTVWNISLLFSSPTRERFHQKAIGHYQKAIESSEEAALLELWDGRLWGNGTDEAMKNFEMRLEYGLKTKDKMIVRSALDHLAYHTMWRARLAEDPDERRELQL